MRRYTAGFSGRFEVAEPWSTMAEYLARFDRHAAVNVACLIPNGNVRMDVMGLETRPPTRDELQRMRRIIRQAMEEGAVGISSGLDYIPSRYAQTDELAELCREIAPYGGVYVTHMRGYAPDNVIGAMDEVFRIAREAGSPPSSRTSTARPTSCSRTSTGRAPRGSTWRSTSTAISPARPFSG